MKLMFPAAEHGRVNNLKGTWFNYNGWPSVTMDDRGVLYAVASSMRLSHVDPCGKNCMYVSYDQGKTWSPPVIINDSYFDDRDAGIVYCGNGKMVFSWFTETLDNFFDQIQEYPWFGDGPKAISKGFGDALRTLDKDFFATGNRSYVKVSEDYGITWSDPIRVNLTAPHGPSVCKDGTLVYMGKEMIDEYVAPSPIVVYSSHDGGYTWTHTGTVPVGEDCIVENMHEPHIVELPSGRLLGAIRVHERKTEPMLSTYITYSDDKGATWSVPKCIGVDGMPPHLMVHSSGAVICSYSRRTNGIRSERAVVSYDGGETWTEDYTINDNLPYVCDMGYPASCELQDGSILTVYYQPWPGEGNTSVLWTKWRLGDNAGGDEALEAFKKLDAEMEELRKSGYTGGWE